MTLNCSGKVLDLSEPKVMAICNITSDSFYAGSRADNEKDLIKMVEKHLREGADIVDIGGMSSRPGAEEIPVEDEIEKVSWAIKIIKREYPGRLISVDTYRAKVVDAVADLGANIVNDISGGALDKDLLSTVAKHNMSYVLMHMKDRPKNMQNHPVYNNGVVMHLLSYLKNKIHECRKLGIQDIIVDPGFGFGKSIEDNYKMLKSLHSFFLFDVPVMIGLSRKSMIYKVIGEEATGALNGTTALHMVALLNGAQILRVHDVKEAKECIALYNMYTSV